MHPRSKIVVEGQVYITIHNNIEQIIKGPAGFRMPSPLKINYSLLHSQGPWHDILNILFYTKQKAAVFRSAETKITMTWFSFRMCFISITDAMI